MEYSVNDSKLDSNVLIPLYQLSKVGTGGPASMKQVQDLLRHKTFLFEGSVETINKKWYVYCREVSHRDKFLFKFRFSFHFIRPMKNISLF